MSVLITEIGGAGRWQQASITFPFVKSFFGGDPQDVDHVKLYKIGQNGQTLSTHDQHALYKPNSSNWAFELPDVEGVPYPGIDNRPIAIFRQWDGGGYGYELLMPSDIAYPAVAQLLQERNKEPGLRRAIVEVTELAGAWPGGPLSQH